MKPVEALEHAAAERGWETLVVCEPSGNVDTLEAIYATFSRAPLYRDIEVGVWEDGEVHFRAPDITEPDVTVIRQASFRLISEAGKRLMTYAMLGQSFQRSDQ